MATYKGVSASEISQSIRDAKEFVYSLIEAEQPSQGAEQINQPNAISHLFSTLAGIVRRPESKPDLEAAGKVIRDYIDEITEADIEAIKNSQTDQDLAEKARNLQGTFIFMSDLFLTHGYLDTNGQGRDIAYGIEKWEAMSGARAAAFYEIDGAIEDHLSVYPKPSNQQREEYYQSRPPAYMTRYGIEFEHSEDDRAEKIEELRGEVLAALAPFADIGESGMTGYGIIGDSYDETDRKVGLIFETSKAGAQAVAAAMPNYIVLDYNKNPVTAAQNANLPKPGQNQPKP